MPNFMKTKIMQVLKKNAGVGFMTPEYAGLMNQTPTMNQAPANPRRKKTWAMALGFLEFADGGVLCKG